MSNELAQSRYNLQKFLESAPLKKRVKGALPPGSPNAQQLYYPAVNMHCPWCGREQTFKQVNICKEPDYGSNEVTLLEKTFAVIYECQGHTPIRGSSRNFHFYLWFLLRFHEDETVEKMGQYPRNDTSIDPRVGPLLGDQKLYYRRGRESEDESYGIGAMGYYRRVVENIIDKLLKELGELIPEKDRVAYDEALAKVSTDRRASEKIEAVKDLMPESLNIAGQNPLQLLHSVMSEGLHERTEEQILELSGETRTLLDYLLIEISDKKNRAISAKEALKNLLKRSQLPNESPQ